MFARGRRVRRRSGRPVDGGVVHDLVQRVDADRGNYGSS